MSGYDPQNRIDVEPLARAFQASGRSAHEVAREMGWVKGDGTRLKRALGLVHSRNGSRKPHRVRTIDADRAACLAQLLDLDPTEVGL